MSFTPNQLATISLVLLALGLMIAAGALIAMELRRSRSGQVIGRALRRDTTTQINLTTPLEADAELGAPLHADIELPFHWLDSRIGRALVADEDRRLIDQCGFASKRAQLIFLVTRLLLAFLLPVVIYVVCQIYLAERSIFVALVAAFVIGFMTPKWVLRRIATGRRERIARELPLFIDLLKLLQGVGLSLDQSLQIMADDFSHVLRVLGYELTLANRQYSQGRTREHSLHRLATLHGSEDLRGLVSLLVQVDRHGGAVQEPLRIFGERLRERRQSEMKARIGKITVKMTAVMVVTLLPALVIVTAGPGFIAIFRALGATSQ
ncbi:secretion system protein [Variovorax sp. RO1]|uniref:type II secretion system F family protein n=1 Tax=Variovorax sp. RO1 TaxID=2066034 RepID=UPI000C71714F|nr:type II secretion system F family protein [Variovorax sp. RO1]PLC05880.1 secretion system protein [Variovorax sp. RO1]